MKSFEKVRDVHIHPEGFSIENGLVTPTMKNRVNILTQQCLILILF